jgi:hypothetical protein
MNIILFSDLVLLDFILQDTTSNGIIKKMENVPVKRARNTVWSSPIVISRHCFTCPISDYSSQA